MKLEYPCDRCRIKPLCKRFERVEKVISAIEDSHWRNPHTYAEWSTEVVIDFGSSDQDGLIFEMKCDDFVENDVYQR